jgi:hypothetical protein
VTVLGAEAGGRRGIEARWRDSPVQLFAAECWLRSRALRQQAVVWRGLVADASASGGHLGGRAPIARQRRDEIAAMFVDFEACRRTWYATRVALRHAAVLVAVGQDLAAAARDDVRRHEGRGRLALVRYLYARQDEDDGRDILERTEDGAWGALMRHERTRRRVVREWVTMQRPAKVKVPPRPRPIDTEAGSQQLSARRTDGAQPPRGDNLTPTPQAAPHAFSDQRVMERRNSLPPLQQPHQSRPHSVDSSADWTTPRDAPPAYPHGGRRASLAKLRETPSSLPLPVEATPPPRVGDRSDLAVPTSQHHLAALAASVRTQWHVTHKTKAPLATAAKPPHHLSKKAAK